MEMPTWVSKDDNSTKAASHSGRQHRCSIVHKLPSLTVPCHHNLGVGTLRDGLLCELGHHLGAVCVATRQETLDIGRVVHTLNSEILRSNLLRESLEERWSGDCANVAAFRCPPSKDDNFLGTVGGCLSWSALGALRALEDTLKAVLCGPAEIVGSLAATERRGEGYAGEGEEKCC